MRFTHWKWLSTRFSASFSCHATYHRDVRRNYNIRDLGGHHIIFEIDLFDVLRWAISRLRVEMALTTVADGRIVFGDLRLFYPPNLHYMFCFVDLETWVQAELINCLIWELEIWMEHGNTCQNLCSDFQYWSQLGLPYWFDGPASQRDADRSNQSSRGAGKFIRWRKFDLRRDSMWFPGRRPIVQIWENRARDI